MLVAACDTFELTARMTGNTPYRAAAGVTVAAAFILVWINLAVGLNGSEDDPANLMNGGVLAVAIIGAVIAPFRPRGMARTLAATGLTHQGFSNPGCCLFGSLEQGACLGRCTCRTPASKCHTRCHLQHMDVDYGSGY